MVYYHDKFKPSIFHELSNLVKSHKSDLELIDMGIGDPDIAFDKKIAESFAKNIVEGTDKFYHYPSTDGHPILKKSIIDWYERIFNFKLQDENVTVFKGIKEAISYMCLFANSADDIIMVPDPGYPTYKLAAETCGAGVYEMPLLEENDYLPNLNDISDEVFDKAKVMFLNYPNNPTGATMSKEQFAPFLEKAVKHDFIICLDRAYNDLSLSDDTKKWTVFDMPGADKHAIGMYSMSKPYNACGMRIGFATAGKTVIEKFSNIKNVSDNGVFIPTQLAYAEALQRPDILENNIKIYKERCEIFKECFDKLGIQYLKPKATFYMWVKVPNGKKSREFVMDCFKETAVLFTPGIGFGKYGDDYFRI
ncbi:MAG: aminotransferase class I/II-fold pyridoxal phosphate-dependent enzyme, partial [Elusimicrobiaceae bacterium]|nr:aminotransferase class I/II-fold pyridoxal phosphate-dependent enzyme [Elusimicrobiaceae bacterium]